jgi:hypothetical protein
VAGYDEIIPFGQYGVLVFQEQAVTARYGDPSDADQYFIGFKGLYREINDPYPAI